MRPWQSRRFVDQQAITAEHAQCLAVMLNQPMMYTRRCVEQLSFLPNGGQRWLRTLQIRIPETATPAGVSWRIVPLGQYARRRFPDFTACRADGSRINLVTRRQHGIALTKATLANHFYTLPRKYRRRVKRKKKARKAYNELRNSLYNFFTEAGDLSEDKSKSIGKDITMRYGRLLMRGSFKAKEELEKKINTFAKDFTALFDTTQYLCWIDAEPGEVVNIEVLYTTRDTKHKLKRGSVSDAIKSVFSGLVGYRDKRSEVRADWYRQFGLAPFNYEFDIPSQHHAGSYYFTLEPPSLTETTYLDWEVGNSAEDSEEVDCSLHSAHVHNDDEPTHNGDYPAGSSDSSGRTIRAYLRRTPLYHKQILGTVTLNAIFVVLLIIGQLKDGIGNPAQGLVLTVPSVLTAYLVQQQRHYYTRTTRRQRFILWGYLAVSVGFLVSITFSKHKGGLVSQNLGLTATLFTWLLAVGSAAVLAWHLPLGYSFERMTEWLTKRKWQKVKLGKPSFFRKIGIGFEKWIQKDIGKRQRLRSAMSIFHRWWFPQEPIKYRWQCYTNAVERYCSWIMYLVIILVAATVFALWLTWDFAATGTSIKNEKHIAITRSAQSSAFSLHNSRTTISPASTRLNSPRQP